MADEYQGDVPGRYLVLAASFVCVLLVGVVAVSATVKFGTGLTQDGAILRFQQAKINRSREVDTIFVGDSSLGNAISSAQFDRLTGTHSLNLALMARFGYSGTYNMMRRALAAHPSIRNVVIVQSAEMMGLPASFDGYVLSAPDFSLSELDPSLRKPIMLEFLNQLIDWRPILAIGRYVMGQQVLLTRNDYVAQGPSVAEDGGFEFVSPGKVLFLKEIVKLCVRTRLNCVYAHGPLRESVMSRIASYLIDANREIMSTGIRLVMDQPMPLPAAYVGDSRVHVAPMFKAASTEYYAERLEPFLTLRNNTASEATSAGADGQPPRP